MSDHENFENGYVSLKLSKEGLKGGKGGSYRVVSRLKQGYHTITTDITPSLRDCYNG